MNVIKQLFTRPKYKNGYRERKRKDVCPRWLIGAFFNHARKATMIGDKVRSRTRSTPYGSEAGKQGRMGDTTLACRSWAERRRRRAQLGVGDAKAETNLRLGTTSDRKLESHPASCKLFGREACRKTRALLSPYDCTTKGFCFFVTSQKAVPSLKS